MRALVASRLAAWIQVVLIAAPLASQQTWPVANHQELLAAVAAATPGDVIQLTPDGVFQGFTLNTGVTLRGPGRIGGNYPLDYDIQAAIPDGQLAQFVDVTFVPSPVPAQYVYPLAGAIHVRGSARFENCTIRGAGGNGALELTRANALVQRCTVVAYNGANGVWAADSRLSIHDTSMRGSNAERAPMLYSCGASPGLSCSGSGSLQVSSSTVTGGRGLYVPPYGYWLPADALVTGVPTWISDSSVQGGSTDGPYPGGDALVATGAAHARCTFAGGAGVPFGQPILGTALLDPTLLGGSASGPLRMGQQVVLRWLADQPGVAVGILVTSGVRAPVLHPVVPQPLWLGEVTFLLAAGVTTSAADFQLTLLVPVDPVLTNLPCDFVGFRPAGAGMLQTAPLLGGVIR